MDFVQEMGALNSWLKVSQLHPTNLFLSLNLWCKDLVPKKGKGEEVSVWLFRPRDCLSMLNRKWTFYKRWVPQKADSTGVVSPKILFLSLDLWRKDLVPQKKKEKEKEKEKQWVCDFSGHWTVFMHWTESGLCTRDGWLKPNLQRRRL